MPCFTLQGFKQATGMEDPHQVRMLLHRWAKVGHIIPIKKGIYMPKRFHDLHSRDENFLPAVSAILLPQSYLSLEFILQQNVVLAEVTYPVTAVTFKNTRRVVNRLGTFWYRNLRSALYHGFTISEYFGIPIARASLSKALFDTLYLRPLASVQLENINLAEELRLNLDEFSTTDREEFAAYVEESHNHKMQRIYQNFRSTVWQHSSSS